MAKLRNVLISSLILVSSVMALAADAKPNTAEAARLNNLGVALMNQQRYQEAERDWQGWWARQAGWGWGGAPWGGCIHG